MKLKDIFGGVTDAYKAVQTSMVDAHNQRKAAAFSRKYEKEMAERSHTEAELFLDDMKFQGNTGNAAQLLHGRLKQRGLTSDEAPRSGLYMDGDDEEREDW
jgi:hypothetical protein